MPADYGPADLRDVGLVPARAKLFGDASDSLLLRRRDAGLRESDPVAGVRQGHRVGVYALPVRGRGLRVRSQPFDRARPAVNPVVYRAVFNSHVSTPGTLGLGPPAP